MEKLERETGKNMAAQDPLVLCHKLERRKGFYGSMLPPHTMPYVILKKVNYGSTRPLAQCHTCVYIGEKEGYLWLAPCHAP